MRSVSLYWFTRCDRCGAPVTAFAMSIETEDMLCLACLELDGNERAARRAARRAGSGAEAQRRRPPAGVTDGGADPAQEAAA